MKTVNSVTLLGNIARIPDIRVTSGGKKFATFVVATHKDGPTSDNSSEFHNVVAWGSLASIAENFCSKGRLIYLEGYLKTRSWEHENGAKIFRTEVVATNIIALSKPRNHEEDLKIFDTEFDTENEEDFFNVSPEDFYTK